MTKRCKELHIASINQAHADKVITIQNRLGCFGSEIKETEVGGYYIVCVNGRVCVAHSAIYQSLKGRVEGEDVGICPSGKDPVTIFDSVIPGIATLTPADADKNEVWSGAPTKN